MEPPITCRSCLTEITLQYISLDTCLYDTTVLEVFNFCTKLKASLDDEFPTSMCIPCGTSLQTAYDFIKTAYETDQFLRGNISSQTEKEEDDDSDKKVIQTIAKIETDSEKEYLEEYIDDNIDDNDSIEIKKENGEVKLEVVSPTPKEEIDIEFIEDSSQCYIESMTNSEVPEESTELDDFNLKNEDDDDCSRSGNSCSNDEFMEEIEDDTYCEKPKKAEPMKNKQNKKETSTQLSKKRQTWNKEDMKAALFVIKEKKMGYLKASKIFGVPRTTLRRLAVRTHKPVDDLISMRLGRKPIFPLELEDSLIEYVALMKAKFFGVTGKDIQSLAFQLAVKNNIPNRFSLKKEAAGKDWLRLFLKRHPSLLFIQPTETSVARAAKGFSKENVTIFFDLLQTEMNTYNFSPNNIYNVGEIGMYAVAAKIPKILTLKRKQIGALTSSERESLITSILCMSAGGSFVPPMFIFPWKKDDPLLMKEAPPGSIHANHPSGSVQTNLFTKWFKHFIATVKPTTSSPVLLIMDGHASHTKNIEFIDLASNNHVRILSIPPHSCDKLQPLDNAFMESLNHYLTEEITKWVISNTRALTHVDIIELFGRSYMKTKTKEIAVKGFATTGIYPFDPNIFKDQDFVAAKEVDENLTTEGPMTFQPNPVEPEWHASNFCTSNDESLKSEADAHICETSTSSGIRPSSDTFSNEISPVPIRLEKVSRRYSRT